MPFALPLSVSIEEGQALGLTATALSQIKQNVPLTERAASDQAVLIADQPVRDEGVAPPALAQGAPPEYGSFSSLLQSKSLLKPQLQVEGVRPRITPPRLSNAPVGPIVDQEVLIDDLQQTQVSFSLQGTVLGLKVPLLSIPTVRGEAYVIRGRWVYAWPVYVFVGYGVRLPYAIRGFTFFGNGRYHACDPADGTHRDPPTLRAYGTAKPLESLPPTEGKSVGIVRSALVKYAHKAFEARLVSSRDLKPEPILVEVSDDQAAAFRVTAQQRAITPVSEAP